MVNPYNKYYSAIKSTEVLIHAPIKMDLKNNMLMVVGGV